MIKLLFLDFDGTLTNNKVIFDENGKESVICDRSDSLAISMLKEQNIDVIVISKEKNKVVQARCKKLNIPAIIGIDDKLSILKGEIKKRGLSKKDVCFVGNDINDIECIKYVGLGIAVGDAYPDVKKTADIVTKKYGGDGAIREVMDILCDIK